MSAGGKSLYCVTIHIRGFCVDLKKTLLHTYALDTKHGKKTRPHAHNNAKITINIDAAATKNMHPAHYTANTGNCHIEILLTNTYGTCPGFHGIRCGKAYFHYFHSL